MNAAPGPSPIPFSSAAGDALNALASGARGRVLRLAALLSCLAAMAGCAAVSVAGAAVGAAVSVTGAVVATGVKVTGKVIEKTIDVVVP